jgi:hypothetical protein
LALAASRGFCEGRFDSLCAGETGAAPTVLGADAAPTCVSNGEGGCAAGAFGAGLALASITGAESAGGAAGERTATGVETERRCVKASTATAAITSAAANRRASSPWLDRSGSINASVGGAMLELRGGGLLG